MARKTDSDISPTPPLILKRGQKGRNWPRFSTPFALEALCFLSVKVMQVLAILAVNQAMETLERGEYPV